MNLPKGICFHANEDDAASLTAFFNAMAMPVPEKGEYTATTDKGGLVFLDAPGCVLRFTLNEAFPAIVHRAVLQPVFSRNLGIFRAEIFPGVRSPVSSEDDLVRAATWLRDDGIVFPDFKEIREDNFGYLPLTDSENPRGMPVALDMGAMKDKRTTDATMDPGPQRILYGELAAMFSQAWPDDAPLPDVKKLTKAWALCLKIKEQGALAADWRQPGRFYSGFKNIKSGGEKYAAAWAFPV